MKIRKATKKDFNEIAEIIKEEYGKQPYKEKWTIQGAIKSLNYYSKWGNIFIAEIDGKIVGFMIIHKEIHVKGAQINIRELAVRSGFQGKGIGTALMKKAEEFGKKNKASSIYLSTSIDSPACKFYEKMGYKASKKTLFFGKFLR